MSSSDRPTGSDRSVPVSPERRGLLFGLAASGVGLMAASVPAAAAAPEPASPPILDRHLVVPFHGPHQAGVTTPQPFAGLVAAFDVLVETREGLHHLFRDLTDLLRRLAEGGRPPVDDPRFPPLDSGIIGFDIRPERLTATVAVGASLFDERFGLAPLKPAQLTEMDAFPNDALVDDFCHGDLCLQICAETPEEVIHALRAVLKAMPDRLAIKWKQEGFTATHGARRGPLGTGRNLFGFKDGTANADVADTALMDAWIWVQPGAGEPAWTAGGSYQVVRLIRNYVEFWDRTPLKEQEQIFGRTKETGAPLGGRDEFEVPNYASDPEGRTIPLTAHIRLANPRTSTETAKLIRRGFNYSNGLTKSGQLDQGLLFVSFQADLGQGFVAAQNRLNGEPLEEYIKPFGGGYFFVLPGVREPSAALADPLFAAAAALPSTPPTSSGSSQKKG